MEKTAVEFIFDAVYRDIPFSELLGIIAQAKIMEKQQDKKMYSEEDMKSFGDWCRNALLNTEYSFEKLDEHLKTWEQIRNK
jgi:hypothetical protein